MWWLGGRSPQALATCSLMHAMEDDDGACQIGKSAKQARLNIYRVFPWVSRTGRGSVCWWGYQ